jgi:hypothetical protein
LIIPNREEVPMKVHFTVNGRMVRYSQIGATVSAADRPYSDAELKDSDDVTKDVVEHLGDNDCVFVTLRGSSVWLNVWSSGDIETFASSDRRVAVKAIDDFATTYDKKRGEPLTIKGPPGG